MSLTYITERQHVEKSTANTTRSETMVINTSIPQDNYVRIDTDMFCGKCSDWDHVGLGIIRILAARRIMKQQRWSTERVNGETLDVCPMCNGEAVLKFGPNSYGWRTQPPPAQGEGESECE